MPCLWYQLRVTAKDMFGAALTRSEDLAGIFHLPAPEPSVPDGGPQESDATERP